MPSAAEQLASGINFGAFSKATELKKRIWFTLAVLVIYRFGTYIPVPGIDPTILADVFRQQQGGILGMFDMFAGGALGRMTIFALNVLPYISSSIIIQLMTTVSPRLEQLKKEGEAGRKKINQYTRYGTVLLATLQGYGIAVGLENMGGPGGSAVLDAGLFFRVTTMVTLTGGTIFLMWLGEQITAAWHWQRYFIDHFCRDRRQSAGGVGGYAGTWTYRRAIVSSDRIFADHGLCRDRVHSFHRARATPFGCAIPQTPSWQPNVRGRKFASAAQTKYRRRYPADLCIVAIVATNNGRKLLGVARAELAARHNRSAWSRAAGLHDFVSHRHCFLLFFLHSRRIQPERHGR